MDGGFFLRGSWKALLLLDIVDQTIEQTAVNFVSVDIEWCGLSIEEPTKF
jgi:hypothetical protein